MIIGVPKETKNNEYRVGLTPESSKALCEEGHKVLVQSDAGSSIGFSDQNYIDSGARIINEAKEVFDQSDLIIKVKEPIDQELDYLREDLTLFTYLHLAGDPKNAKKIVDTGVTGIAYETVTDENNALPLLAPMSKIAGQISIVVGSYNLLKHNHGKGVLLGSFKDLDSRVVTVIGGGVAGSQAIDNAINNKALVNVIDLSVDTLNSLKAKYGEDNVNYIQSSPDAIVECIKESDLVVGSVYVIGKEAPKIITKDMISEISSGTVMVDISIDQGGCFETSKPTTHDEPTFLVDNVVHYCVTNMPGAVPLTASLALNKATLPYIKLLANLGIEEALNQNPGLQNGLNISKGEIKHQAVSEALS